MFTKSNLLGTLAGFVVLFLGGWVFYDMLAADFYASHTTAAGAAAMRGEETMNLLYIAIGCLVQACIMQSIYSKLAEKGNGFKFGAYFGVFVGLGIGVLNFGVMDLMDMTGHLVDAVWSIVFYGITGLAIATVSNKFAD